MPIKYGLSGGKLYIDKQVLAKELLMNHSTLKPMLKCKDTSKSAKQPRITKNSQNNMVTIDYKDASDIELDEKFETIFRDLKSKYQHKIKGKITIRINYQGSYHMVIDLDANDDTISFS